MNKKGFTLVELLAVIAILGLLVIITLPNIMSLFNEAKKNSFTSELKQIYKTAQNQWMTDSMFETNEKTYARCKSNNCNNKLKLSGREEIEYFIKLNKNGNVTEYYATDGTYQYSYKGLGVKIEDINDVVQVSKITNGKYVTISCTKGKISSPEPANSNYYLKSSTNSGGPFLNTNIDKRSIEYFNFTDSIEGHSASDENCWDVSLGNNGSVLAWATDSDNNGLYELTIGANGDVYASSGFALFHNMTELKSISGMEFLNTSKATSMAVMFEGCNKLTSIDLSHLDTSNVTVFEGMFNMCRNIKHLDLSNFDTSKATKFHGFFQACDSLTSLDLSSFDTSNVINMAYMFNGDNSLKTIYVSNNFNTSLVTDSTNMFSSNYSIVGGQGTVYNNSHIDKEYARIDGGTSSPGYFTSK